MRASYPTYKSTSITWPDSIPESWELVKISSVFRERRETVSDKDFTPLSVTMQGIVPQLETAAKTDNGDNRKKVCAGDFVINSRSDRKGSAGISPSDGSVSVISIVLKPSKKLHAKYVDYLLTNYYFQEEFYRYGKGIVADLWSTKYSSMKGMFIPLPSLEEQTAIANYLDAKTEQINRFIAKKEKLIVLLKEQKQAVINELLEDKEGKRERRKLKYFCSLITKGTTPSTEGKEFTNSGVRFLKAENITENGLSESPWFFIDEATNQILKRSQLKANDILIVIAGATIGRTAIITESFLPANTNQAVCLLRLKKYVDPKFIRLLLSSPKIQKRVRFDAVQSAQPNLSMGVLGDFLLPYPKLESERQLLVNTIEEESNRIDALIQRITVEIEKVKELKQSLIAEAVTGNIKVA